MQKHHVCPWWLTYTFDNPLRRLFHRPAIMFAGLVKPGMTVLDIGCGMGYFSIGLARLVGPQGKVLAVDLQQRMLDTLRRRAARAGVAGIIETRQCTADRIGVKGEVDFALAFWMVHETPDQAAFFRELALLLKPGGKVLVAEPKFHVTAGRFQEILADSGRAGFAVAAGSAITFSRAAVLSL
ncbi:MAG: hypothetical protein A2521_05565 [Deltaproteobacteria bacterium RIFOXYD12_FULL_57_12]|nr:MAG: hypothetical protein A2521_05565 [Deltaproteobacteria bacterium RIFOXYD12_FULL_57_12]